MKNTVKLGHICKLNYGKALDRKDRLENGVVSVYGANGIKTYTDKFLHDKPSIIIGRKGSAGELNKVAEPFWALDVTYFVTVDESIVDLDFLFYSLITLNLPSMARGVKPGINRNDVYDKSINLPSLAEQERIVAKLDAVFAEIDRTIEALESKKQEANKLKALLLSEKLCFTSHKKIKIGDVLKTSAGGTPLKSHKEYYENGDINWLLSGAVNKQNIIKCRTHITQQGLQNSSAKVFPINTVLVAMYGATAGQVGILRIEAATNQAVCGIYPSSEYLPEFLYFYLENYKKTLLEEASGTAQPNISQSKIKNVPLPVISISDQQEIISLVETIFLNLKKFTITLDKNKDNYVSLKSAILSKELQSSEAA